MNYIKDVSLRVANNNKYNAIVEIPKFTNKKLELVEPDNDRVASVRKTKCRYPFFYGSFPQTLAEDKDPLDVIIISKKLHYKPLTIKEVSIIGVIKTIDNGEKDDKILAVDSTIKKFNYKKLKRILKFLKKYKGKNSGTIVDDEIYPSKVAIGLINKCNESYLNKDKKPEYKIKEVIIDGTLGQL